MGILGILCGLYTFVWGWQNKEEYELEKVMPIWSFLILCNMVLSLVAVLAID